ncbi:MAG: hypothetical protein AB1627_12395 [Chloroflexota bacterium]
MPSVSLQEGATLARRNVRAISAYIVSLAVALAHIHAAALDIQAHSPPNFGSNWGHICDTTKASQCKGWAAGLDVALYSLEDRQDRATRDTISTDYNPTDLLMTIVLSGDDIGVFDGLYGTSGNVHAWTSCAPGATYSGSEAAHTRACTPHDVHYNLSFPAFFDSDGESFAIACHEIGHTVGLRHNGTGETTCMREPPGTTKKISTHERNHINANY